MKLLIGDQVVQYDNNFVDVFDSMPWTIIKVRNVFYARCGRIFMHRLVMQAAPGQIVDHIDGDGLNNKIKNLSFTSRQGNKANQHHGLVRKTSSFIGVSKKKDRNCFVVQMKIDGKAKFIGSSLIEEDAARIYDAKAREIYGDLAITNFKL